MKSHVGFSPSAVDMALQGWAGTSFRRWRRSPTCQKESQNGRGGKGQVRWGGLAALVCLWQMFPFISLLAGQWLLSFVHYSKRSQQLLQGWAWTCLRKIMATMCQHIHWYVLFKGSRKLRRQLKAALYLMISLDGMHNKSSCSLGCWESRGQFPGVYVSSLPCPYVNQMMSSI